MALHRGIQSAVFYYLSCAPCADARYRKKRKQEAVRDRADWEELETQMPNLYRHPSPSSTNPHWQAEIAMGPSLASRKRKGSQRDLKSSAAQSSNGSNLPSSIDLPRGARSWDEREDSGWNLKQYQREDEILWGGRPETPLRSHVNDTSNASREPARPARAKVKDASSSLSSYQEYRNPALNDLHPAIVTRVNTRADVAWMLQPPPVADVMSGKQLVPRSRSNSGNSRPSTNGSTTLARTLSTRIMESKRQGHDSSLGRPRSARSKQWLADDPLSQDRVDIPDSARLLKDNRIPVLIAPTETSSGSGSSVVRKTSMVSDLDGQIQPRRTATKSQLSTVMSETTSPVYSEDESTYIRPYEIPKENYFPDARSQHIKRDKTARRSGLIVDDPSFNALPPKTKAALAFNTQIFATAHPGVEKTLQVPRAEFGQDIENEDARRNTGGPEMFEDWNTPDFELDKWVHEHTKRDVTQRWSMDL